jgi:hypothetical protein
LRESQALVHAGNIIGAQVAQLVEQRTENPRVGGSIPPLGTIQFKYLHEKDSLAFSQR